MMSSNEGMSMSSVCSGSDMNDSLDDLDQVSSMMHITDGEDMVPGAYMDNERRHYKECYSDSETSNNNMAGHSGDEGQLANSAKKAKAKKENRKCTVCGDKALGYNFDAITCESCKAFFRRNANKPKHPRCMFQNSCQIDANTRRFCSACRLQKCFSVGMKKEMILGDDERQKRIEKVQQNRAKKLVQLQRQTGVDIMSDIGAGYMHKASPQAIDELCSVKAEAKAGISPGFDGDQAVWSMLNAPQSAVLLSDPPLESDDSMYRILGKKDAQLISHIGTTYSSTFGSTAEETPMKLETASLEALMNHIGVLVKLLIKFAKKLVDFTDLPQKAQVTLLKGSLLVCISWRSAQMYNIEKGTWVHDEGTEVPKQLLNAAFDQVDSNIQQEHIKLISSIKRTVGSDITLVALIQCITLFSPEFAAPGTRALTASIQDKYITLLKHYLEAHHNWKDAFEMYSSLFHYMAATKVYTLKHSKAFAQCDTSQVEPLLLEVFDISTSVR